jgi:hypothetical protein
MTEEQSAKKVVTIISELAETDPAEYLRMVHLVTSMDEAQLDDFLAQCHARLSGAANDH